MQKVLIICGPTAMGKTALAAKLAKKFNGELVSADSRQVYKGMDIVTGKDRPSGAIIHGLDLVEPNEDFSVAHFVQFASNLINQISLKGKLPIIVGGTGLYINSLINPPETMSIPPDWQLRQELEKRSLEELQKQLHQLNSSKWLSMNHSDRLNPRRLVRAIEVEKSRQGPAFASQRTDLLYNARWIGLTVKNNKLDQKIAVRVNERVKQGALDEWEKLKQKYPLNLPSMSGIGYRQLPDVAAWIRAEQRYARRQLTYFKKIKAINWNPPEVVKTVKAWYTKS